MWNRRKVAMVVPPLVFVSLLLAITCALFRAAPREPTSGGKTLSQWLIILATPRTIAMYPYLKEDGTEREQPMAAIDDMGTNALRCLVDYLNWDPRRSQATLRFLPRLPKPLQENSVLRRLLGEDNLRRWEGAQTALWLLGPKAKPVIPELTELMVTSQSRYAYNSAMSVLVATGPEGVRRVQQATASPRQEVRLRTVRALGGFRNCSESSLPILRLIAESDVSETVRAEARNSIKNLTSP